MVSYQRYQTYHMNSRCCRYRLAAFLVCIFFHSTEFDGIIAQMLELIQDADKILATDVNYLLGTWIETARSWGKKKQKKAEEMTERFFCYR